MKKKRKKKVEEWEEEEEEEEEEEKKKKKKKKKTFLVPTRTIGTLKARFFLLKCCWTKCKTYGYLHMCLFGPKRGEFRGVG